MCNLLRRDGLRHTTDADKFITANNRKEDPNYFLTKNLGEKDLREINSMRGKEVKDRRNKSK
jgi:hypothetical protein